MCTRVSLKKSVAEIEDYFGATFVNPQQYLPRNHINAREGPLMPVITQTFPRNIVLLRWGVPVSWSKERIVNMRSERILTTFPELLGSKCVSILDGFYEGPLSQPTLFTTKTRLFCVACVFSYVPDKDASYAVLTKQATGKVATVHHRMPIILEREEISSWLQITSLEDFQSFLKNKGVAL